MLLELRIQNFALIERAEIRPGGGFNVLTGETGAGKSILIQALGLLLGERAAAEQVGRGSVGKALVEGAFSLAEAPAATAWLQENDFWAEDAQLIISREVGADGRSRVRLNGRLATATALRELGEHLVDLHGQHEHQLLMRPEAHLALLDSFGDKKHAELRTRVRAAHKTWREALKRLAELSLSEQTRAQRVDMLEFQVQEIDGVAPEPAEDDRLAEERGRLLNSERLRAAATLCRDALFGEEEPGAISLARQALKAAQEIETMDASVAAWVEELKGSIFEMEDAATEAREYLDGLEADPVRLEEIEARLHQLARLKRKYGATLEKVEAYRESIGHELEGLVLSDEQVAALRQAAASQQALYNRSAEELTASRFKLGKVLGAAVLEQLKDLALERAQLEVGFEQEATGTAGGRDRVEFLFSANPGQPLRPLAKIASGGEISRVMLALRSALRKHGEKGAVPIVIFDEIDSGIGGLTAESVGKKMQEIASAHQVFCITHLPQIARRANHHYRVEKSSAQSSTSVNVVPLEGEDRVVELARMMGSESPENMDHARVLLAGA